MHAVGKGFKPQSERSIGTASSLKEGDGGEIVTSGYGLHKEAGSTSKVGAYCLTEGQDMKWQDTEPEIPS